MQFDIVNGLHGVDIVEGDIEQVTARQAQVEIVVDAAVDSLRPRAQDEQMEIEEDQNVELKRHNRVLREPRAHASEQASSYATRARTRVSFSLPLACRGESFADCFPFLFLRVMRAGCFSWYTGRGRISSDVTRANDDPARGQKKENCDKRGERSFPARANYGATSRMYRLAISGNVLHSLSCCSEVCFASPVYKGDINCM